MDLIRVRHRNGEIVPRFDHVAAREHAVALLAKAGFRLHQVSQSTTTAYYVHPWRAPLVLRVADHPRNRDMIGMPNTVAKLTLSPKDQYLTECHVENLVVMAIGRYFLSDPKPSRYDGPRSQRKPC